MLSIIVRINDQQIVELTSAIPTPAFMEAIAINYGGVASDYTFYTTTAEEEARIDNGDQYTLVWEVEKLLGIDFKIEDEKGWLSISLSSPTNKVTLNTFDVSQVKIFDSEVSYLQNELVYSADGVYKCQKVSSSVDPATQSTDWSREAFAIMATFNILLADKATIDTAANFKANLAIRLPGGSADLELNFVAGKCQKVIVLNSTNNCGTWTLPQNDTRVTLNSVEYRVVNQVSFKGILPY